MNKESQNTEWKSSWRDEYLAWICGYANAKGGKLFIGKDDKGKVIGLENSKKLLEDIPNKVQNILGISVDVDLHIDGQYDYLEITVDPYPTPISYKGEYHYRSGSTKQILKGSGLNRFLLNKMGKSWDSTTVSNIKVEDLDKASLLLFKEFAKKAGRMTAEQLDVADIDLIDSLNLSLDNELKRASVLLFHERPEKFFPGSFIKIGFFKTETELAFQDEIKGSLFHQIQKTLELLKTKYFHAEISYDEFSRIEKIPYPIKAIREALMNAVAHKDYSIGNPIQISVYKDKFQIWNEGKIPLEWSLEKFLGKHPSKAPNPDMANTFFRAGLIEAWGLGIKLIVSECQNYGLPDPIFNFDFDGLSVEFRKENKIEGIKIIRKKGGSSSDYKLLLEAVLNGLVKKPLKIKPKELEQLINKAKKLEPKSLKLLSYCNGHRGKPLPRKELLEHIQVTNQTINNEKYIKPLIDNDLIEYLIKDKPKSKFQKYILTFQGKKLAQIIDESLSHANSNLS